MTKQQRFEQLLRCSHRWFAVGMASAIAGFVLVVGGGVNLLPVWAGYMGLAFVLLAVWPFQVAVSKLNEAGRLIR